MSAVAVTPELEDFVKAAFRDDAIEKTGMHGKKDAPVAFTAAEGGKILGTVIVQLFWGQLHVKNVIVDKAARGKGIAAKLMQQAHDYGRAQGCSFVFVETLSFQAEGFYEKLGYHREFKRDGYAANAAYIYMKKDLT